MRSGPRLVHLLAIGSGAAALIYEVAWTRLSAVFVSATSSAVAAVLACFMGGLGLGAYVGGQVAERTERPLRAYALVEIAVGVWALALYAVQRAVDLDGIALSGAVRALTAAALFVPPAFAMGMTLPLLVRFVATVRGVASLYAANTLGAVLGSLSTAYVLLELLGISATQLVAASANFAIAAVALAAARRMRATKPAPEERPEPETSAARLPSWGPLAIAGLVGAASLALEVLATRALALLTHSTIYAFAAVLATFLVGIALGSRGVERRVAHAESVLPTLGTCLSLFAVFSASTPLILLAIAQTYGERLRGGSVVSTSGWLMLCAAGVCLVPTLASGAAFPLLSRLYMEQRGRLASAVGAIYIANTAGAVLGSLTAGFLLLPHVGLQHSFTVVAAVALTALVLVTRRKKTLAWAGGGALIPILLLPTFGVQIPIDLYRSALGEGWRVVAMQDAPGVSILVADRVDTPGRRGLWLDGSYVAGTGGGHLLLAHAPMLRHGDARRILGACMGTGQTLGAIAEYPIERLDGVELFESVTHVTRSHFADFNRGLFDRPEVEVHIDDIRAHLRRSDETYDIVTAEPLQPWSRGAVALYTREYYRALRRHLRPSGIAVQWIPLYEVSPSDLRGIIATFRDTFPDAELWLDYQDVVLLGSDSLPPIAPERLSAQLTDAHVANDLHRIHIENASTLLSKRALGPRALARFARSGRVITDDAPYLEMTAPRSIGRSTEHSNLQSILEAWDGEFEGGEAGPLPRASRAAREALRLRLADQSGRPPSVTEYLSALAIDPSHSQLFARVSARVARAAEAGNPRALRQYEELLRLRPDFGQGWVNLALLAERNGDREAGARILTETLLRNPEVRPAALLNLGVLRARAGEFETARGHFEELARLQPRNAQVRAYLARLPSPPEPPPPEPAP
ncbi:MAG: fused MFS/spermidine synthase [Sandaracinaceae bacterium]